MSIIGADKVVRDIESFVTKIGDSSDLGYELKTSIIREIIRAGAIDTTAMVQAIDYTRSFVVDDGHTFFVGAVNNPDVFYDGFVELPTRNRDGSYREGRYFYQKGIENADFERVFDSIARESFVI